MKKRFLILTCAAAALSQPIAGWAFVAPAQEHRPNYDVREKVAATVARAQNPARDNAEALLRAKVPTLQVHTDGVLGTPRFLSARKGFLTGANGEGKGLSLESLAAVPVNDPNRILKAFLNENAALFGHDASVLNTARVNRDFTTAHNGLRTVVFQQTQSGIPLYDSLLISHVTRNGELVNISDRFLSDPAAAAQATPDYDSVISNPPISARRAVSIAAANLDTEVDESTLETVREPEGATQRQSVRHSKLFGPANAEMAWLPLNSASMRLCWQVIVGTRAQPEQYLMLVDASTGEMHLRRCLTAYAREQNYNVFTSDSPSPFSPGLQQPGTNQPALSNRTMVTIVGALDTNASPADWVYQGPTNNTTTYGNNVQAFLDRDFDELPDGGFMPSGTGTNLTFNYPLDLTRDPITYSNASVVQVFYRVNWYHDTMYNFGFTEAAGNFQTTNFNRGGRGNDEVIMLAQAGADVGYSDNAFFSTPPDGNNGICAMFTWSYPRPNRDGALDSEIVIHELTHGLSNRLLGGGAGISMLQPGGMGEGWSDFYALSLLSEATDEPRAVYANGGYVTYQLYGLTENYYFGVRRYPYCTDLQVNPLTLKDIDPSQASAHAGIPTSPVFGGGYAAEVHNMGEVWCATLWEVRANIIDELGWDPGNRLVIQLVTDGMKLAPPNATFLEARDAIIQADQIDTGGSFYESIWIGFAKRGMGADASVPAANTTTGVVESYELPADIIITPPDGILEVNINPPANSVMFNNDTNALYARVRDTDPVTNATVIATLGATNISLKNDGKPPDFSGRDSTYSGLFVTPTNGTSITIPVLVTAPGKTNSTNFVTYLLVPTPPNDFFANSLKVSSSGTSIFTSNKRATLEKGEPVHGGDSSVSGSLWYNFVPPTTGDVLVDTTGSDFTTVVAVYTNNILTNLVEVASAVGSSSGNRSAYVQFKGIAGVVYRIAIAGASSSDSGGLRLRIGQGLAADTNAPFTTITYPQDGLSVSTNRLLMTGTAVDPEPQPSGIKQIKISVSTSYGESETTVYPTSSFDGPTSTNWMANIALRAGVNKIFVTAYDYAGNQSTPAVVQVTYRAIDPVNDFFVTATPITSNSNVFALNTRNATKEIGEPNHAGIIGGKSAWWIFTPTEDGVLDLSTTNSSFDTVLAVYTGNALTNLVAVGSNDDAYPYSLNGFSHLAQPVKAGVTYHIAVDSYTGVGGAMFLTSSFTPGVLYHVTLNTTGGGTATAPIVDVQSNATVVATATPANGYTFSRWSGDVVSLVNPLTVTVNSDITLTAEFLPAAPITDDFETGDLTKITWVTSTTAPWTVQSAYAAAGQFAARSGAIQGSQTTSLQYTGSFRSDDGSFDLKVSSEPVWDRLAFYVDGTLKQQWSGEIDWTTFAFPLVAGTHTLEWRYSKDTTGDVGLDAAFIDNVRLPIAEPITAETPAKLTLFQQTDGLYYVELVGQTNQIYTLQSSTNLVNWTDLSTAAASAGVLRFYDPTASAANAPRYYRAVVR